MAKIPPDAASPQASFKLKNPDGIGVLYVRRSAGRAWLVTHVGNVRHQATGIPWPEDDGGKRNRMGITPAQQAALNRALPILKQRAIEHQHPNLKAIAEPPAPKGILLSQAIAEFNAARAIERKGKATVSRYRVVAEKLLIGDGSYLNIAFPDSVANLVVFTMTPGHVRFMYGFSFYRHGLQLFLS